MLTKCVLFALLAPPCFSDSHFLHRGHLAVSHVSPSAVRRSSATLARMGRRRDRLAMAISTVIFVSQMALSTSTALLLGLFSLAPIASPGALGSCQGASPAHFWEMGNANQKI